MKLHYEKLWSLKPYQWISSCQKILCHPSDNTMKDIVEDYFGMDRYTGPLHACKEIYMSFNHGKNYWLCLNVNVEKRVAYLFDSNRCFASHEDRENQARLLIIE
ncbi:hypothetical protein ACSBR2_026964 [Camellia fascicularis]